MDADLDLLLIAVYVTADDLLPCKPGNARRSLTDAEVVTLCVAQAIMGIPSDRRFLAVASKHLRHLFPRIPGQAGYYKRRRRLADTLEWLMEVFASQSPEYVGWFNHDRLHESLGDIPPVEFEQLQASNSSISPNGSVEDPRRGPQNGSERLDLNPARPTSTKTATEVAPRSTSSPPADRSARATRSLRSPPAPSPLRSDKQLPNPPNTVSVEPGPAHCPSSEGATSSRRALACRREQDSWTPPASLSSTFRRSTLAAVKWPV